jgi:hypothetical protein
MPGDGWGEGRMQSLLDLLSLKTTQTKKNESSSTAVIPREED